MAIDNELLSLAAIQKAEPGHDTFPAMIRAPGENIRLHDWIAGHAAEVWRGLRQNGALLFRGFAVGGPEEFERAVLSLTSRLHGGYGDLAHTVERCQFVQEATPYPPNRAILFHNEASHTPTFPEQIWFYCQQPASSAGETPLLDCARLLTLLPSTLRNEFERRGLLYVRNFVPGLDVPWQRFFGTDRESEVEAQCTSNGVRWLWGNDGSLKTMTPRPAVLPHGDKKVFFNQILLHHPACLDPGMRAAMADVFGAAEGPRSVFFGDGRPIADTIVEEILRLSIAIAIRFEWLTDDVMMIDNIAVAHARRPFEGSRVVRVALSAFVNRSR